MKAKHFSLLCIIAVIMQVLTACSSEGKADLSIKTNPVGAAVYLDNEYIGVGPLSIKVNPGEHVLRASFAGLDDATNTFKADAGGKYGASLDLTMDKAETTVSDANEDAIADAYDEADDETVIPIEISLEETLELKKEIDSQGSDIVVHNALEFLMAIRDNRTITIDSKDTIYLSPVIVALKENGFCEETGIVVLEDDFEDKDNEGLLFYNNYDGIGVAICGISNLTITSKKNAIVVSSPRYDDVLKFVRCENIQLSNLVLGHTDEGYCCDGVVSFIKSNSISLKNCDLYGCGTEGIIISNSHDIDCNKVIIRDCSYYTMHIEQSNNVHFTDCSFYNNREYEQINIDGSCNEIIFDKCIIKDNQGPLFNVDSDVLMRNCTISHDNELGSIEHVKFENTVINK